MAASSVAFYSPAGNGKVRANDTIGTWIVNAGSMAQSTVTFIEGTASSGDKVSANTRTGYSVATADLTGEPWDFSSGGADDGEHIVVWQYMYEGWDTLAAGGFGIIAADDLATDSFGTWYTGPQAGYIGGWYPHIISPKKNFDAVTAGTAGWTLTGNPAQLTGVDGFGFRQKVLSTISGATDNVYCDAIIVGQGYQITLGDAGSTEGKFSDFTTFEDATTTGRFGFLRNVSGIPFVRGKLIIGFTSGAGNTEFIDSGFTIVWEKVTIADGASSAVDDGFYELKATKGSGTTDITLSQGALKAVSPHTVVIDLSAATTATCTGVNVDRGATITLGSTVIWTDSAFTNCGQIIATSSDFRRNSVSGYTGAADTTAVVWNTTTDTDGKLDGCTITKHATTAHHAIQFGASADPVSNTLRNITFSGFHASNAQNDSTLYFADTGADVTWTVNLIGCSGNISYKKARSGDTVSLVSNPVTLSVHVQDINTAADIADARVWIPVTSTASGRPFNQTISSITRFGATATVTFAADHNMATNDYLHISGSTEPEYNRTFQITKTGATTLTVTVSGTPANDSSGSIKGKWVIINDVTDGSGDVSASYTYAASQPFSGRVRLSSSPYYKTAPISGEVSSTNGLAVTVQLIPDS